jgi:phage/plasmid-associated DNA primase
MQDLSLILLGLMEPAEVKAATGIYRSDMDILGVLGDFLAECITLKRDAQTTSAALSKAYSNWCE